MKLKSDVKDFLKFLLGGFGVLAFTILVLVFGILTALHPETTETAINNIRTICEKSEAYNGAFTSETITGGVEVRCRLTMKQ